MAHDTPLMFQQHHKFTVLAEYDSIFCLGKPVFVNNSLPRASMSMMHIELIILLLSFSVTIVLSSDNLIKRFHFSSICNIEERLRRGCSYELSWTRDFLVCVFQFIHLEGYIGVSRNRSGHCFVHKDCMYPLGCNSADDNHKYVEKYCLHGSWNTLTQSCKCPDGYNGSRCEIYPSGCLAMPRKTYKGQLYRILIDPEQQGKNRFPVACGQNGKILVILRNQGRINFNKTLEEYRNGFFEDNYHQWLGLDAWHGLDKAGCRVIQVNLRLNYTGDGRPYTFRRYRETSLSNETTFYKFKGKSKGWGTRDMPGKYMMANCLVASDKRFSTWDRDNDLGDAENCAARAGSGWWYPEDCELNCNLLGLRKNLWNSTTPQQHPYLRGADLDSWMQENSYIEVAYMNC